MTTDERKQLAAQSVERRLQQAFPSLSDVTEQLASTEKRTFYLGIDPTGPDIHMGHLVPLLMLRDVAQLGHDAVLLIGDFTARIGDPTGKQSTRKSLSSEDVTQNMQSYTEQIKTIFGELPFRVCYNSEWLSRMTFEDVVRLAAHFSVQQMISRDMFQERIQHEQPVFIHEFLYPLMQGYDSVALKADGEIGGNDQVFNMLIGRELSKEVLHKEKTILATKLLVDASSGRKMSKTEGTLIALRDPAHEIRRKVLAMDDAMIGQAFRLCTNVGIEWIDQREASILAGESPREFKEELARELIQLFHGGDAVKEAQEAKKIAFEGSLDEALKVAGICTSLSAARRLIQQRAVQVNGSVIERWDSLVKAGDHLRVGKGHFIDVV